MLPKNKTLVNTVKVDNGDGTYTIINTYQFDVVSVVSIIDIDTKIMSLQTQKVQLPIGAIIKK